MWTKQLDLLAREMVANRGKLPAPLEPPIQAQLAELETPRVRALRRAHREKGDSHRNNITEISRAIWGQFSEPAQRLEHPRSRRGYASALPRSLDGLLNAGRLSAGKLGRSSSRRHRRTMPGARSSLPVLSQKSVLWKSASKRWRQCHSNELCSRNGLSWHTVLTMIFVACRRPSTGNRLDDLSIVLL
jgi:hypothetical protein